jgi:hypothetical protein
MAIGCAVASSALPGCTVPSPFGFGRNHDAALAELTADGKKLGPPPELVREPSPYPTAVGSGYRAPQPQPAAGTAYPTAAEQAAAQLPAPMALPLQNGQDPPAMKLDRSQLAGRLPVQRPPVQNTPAGQPAHESYSPVIEPLGALSAQAAPQLAPQTAISPVAHATQQWPGALPVGPLPAAGSAALTSAAPALPANPAAATTQPAAAQPNSHPASSPVPAHPAPAGAPPAQPAATTATTPVSVPVNSVAASSAAAAVSPSPAPSPENPADVASTSGSAEPETLEALCQKHILALEREIRERTDRKEEAELPALRQKLRLLQLISDRTDDAVDKIEQLPPAEREAFKQMMFALSTWLSPDDAKRTSSRNAKILRSLQEVNNQLSAVSKLDLKNLMFCEKVESFGWYTEFPRAEFTPKQQVILYVEVQNFAAEEKTATAFETELQGRYQIYDAAGNLVDERELPLDREICRNYRRDYFLAYRVYIPADLSAGKYRLELTIEDLKAKQDFKGRKQGEAMIEFSIKS